MMYPVCTKGIDFNPVRYLLKPNLGYYQFSQVRKLYERIANT